MVNCKWLMVLMLHVLNDTTKSRSSAVTQVAFFAG